MKSLLVGLLCSIGLATATTAAAADARLAAPIGQFIDSFNKGDLKAAVATHMGDVAIVDEVAPFVWRGPGAVEAWAGDLAKDATAKGLTDQSVALSPATRELVSGDRAYVIVPAVYSFKDHGKPMREAAQMTFSLRKDAAGAWKINAWTWTGPDPSPAN
ncbi:nuclear transport factor 2 family protein [Phenylobacterium sp.]|uniref:YybH family protein n=1 Tax=Phenylobacterium sp. TaxID=1871053 RepID=UPI0027357E73|nr:nuclear transport factor 2 family protein [Phenylobacterium sp.]MDP3855676.1 nuclear transport factor 2 family protein [Phenylobacterium sp.]